MDGFQREPHIRSDVLELNLDILFEVVEAQIDLPEARINLFRSARRVSNADMYSAKSCRVMSVPILSPAISRRF